MTGIGMTIGGNQKITVSYIISFLYGCLFCCEEITGKENKKGENISSEQLWDC